MGQTLTHGIYLPDEGERNCYNGLASNWSILDGAVGTVAEHTTALAGKAPLVHTHTKSDVTDLLNSNFIPSANNSYDLGSSSYQWNNLYAKRYFYNGVAWGLNKINTWSAVNQYSREIQLIGDRNSFIAPMWEGAGSGMAFLVSDASKTICFGTWTEDTNNNNRKIVDGTKGRMIIRVGEKNNESYLEVEPRGSNTQLGNSSNKWKLFNGVNPGALSLPKIVAKATADISSAIVGSDGETQYLDGTDNYYTAALDGWISICITGFVDSNKLWITVYDVKNETWGTSAESSTSERNTLFIIIPIRANQKMRIRMKCTSVTYARFYPCEGNV